MIADYQLRRPRRPAGGDRRAPRVGAQRRPAGRPGVPRRRRRGAAAGDRAAAAPATAPQADSIGVHVEGLDDVLVRLAQCCTPVPGDEIIGFVTRGRGVSVHRADCANAVSLMSDHADPPDRGRLGRRALRRAVPGRRRGRRPRPVEAAARRRQRAVRPPRQHRRLRHRHRQRPRGQDALRVRAGRSRPPRRRAAHDQARSTPSTTPTACVPGQRRRRSTATPASARAASPRARRRLSDGRSLGRARVPDQPGIRDILAPESGRWRRFVDVFAGVVEAAGYGQVVPPLLEDIGVFQRVGEATEVVSKEMYDFVDKGGRHVALRPELTASICRAFVQHRPPRRGRCGRPVRNFRYEKPQRGRYRQFDQVDVEVLGVDDAHLDVEVIALGWRFFEAPRPAPVDAAAQLARRAGRSSPLRRRRCAVTSARTSTPSAPESRETLARNPLRVLDSKRRQDADADRRRPVVRRLLERRRRRPLRHCPRGLDAPRHPVPRRTAAGARTRLLPAHDVRVRRRHARQRPERARWRWPLRRAGRGARRAADARHRLRHRRRPHADRL